MMLYVLSVVYMSYTYLSPSSFFFFIHPYTFPLTYLAPIFLFFIFICILILMLTFVINSLKFCSMGSIFYSAFMIPLKLSIWSPFTFTSFYLPPPFLSLVNFQTFGQFLQSRRQARSPHLMDGTHFCHLITKA